MFNNKYFVYGSISSAIFITSIVLIYMSVNFDPLNVETLIVSSFLCLFSFLFTCCCIFFYMKNNSTNPETQPLIDPV